MSNAPTGRYCSVTDEKTGGVLYTPKILADFVAAQISSTVTFDSKGKAIRVLDPAVGDGELLSSFLRCFRTRRQVEIYGFDTDKSAVARASKRLRKEFPKVKISIKTQDFLALTLKTRQGISEAYDVIIANPPYVRTQVIGSARAREIAEGFGLTGYVDIYHAFIFAMSQVLRSRGVIGIIVSNRFMTTKTGANTRKAIRESLDLRHVWDLGDTKMFDAAVLPAVILACGRSDNKSSDVAFTSIYETKNTATHKADSVIDALSKNGVVSVPDGRRFGVQHGMLDDSGGVWRNATPKINAWLKQVEKHTWKLFGDVGNIRVGVKTCADKVFIRENWGDENKRPELLRPLLTHHVARKFRADTSSGQRFILYPHEIREGVRQPVELAGFPRSRAYLKKHSKILRGREYMIDTNRKWYEIWVPQNPAAWERTKLVFRDISKKPCFWIDCDGSIVNGDCYWMVCDRSEDEDALWLAAAVGNSTFVETFYDCRFNNKLYAGRRRFITQYVEQFPLPSLRRRVSKRIVKLAKLAYDTPDEQIVEEIDSLVWEAFFKNRRSRRAI